MSKHSLVIGKDLNEVVAANIKSSPLHLYIKGNKYFASFAPPEEVSAAIADSSEYKIARIAPLTLSPSIVSHESLLSMVAGSLADLDANSEIIRITDVSELNTATQRLDIALLHRAFTNNNPELTVLPHEAYAPGFKALKRNAAAISDGIVYVYTKGNYFFTSFYDAVGDVKENGASVSTWLPGWERAALNVNDVGFIDHLHYIMSRRPKGIMSFAALLNYISSSGIKKPVPIVSKEVAKVAEAVAEAVFGKIKDGINTFGSGGMPFTKEKAPKDEKPKNDFDLKAIAIIPAANDIKFVVGTDGSNSCAILYKNGDNFEHVVGTAWIEDKPVCATIKQHLINAGITQTSVCTATNRVFIEMPFEEIIIALETYAHKLDKGDNSEKAVPEKVPAQLPRLSALTKLFDPLNDNAGIVDIGVLANRISRDPSLATKDYFVYTVKGMNFVSDRCTVGSIFDEDDCNIGNILGDNLCICMTGAEIQRQVKIGMNTEITSVDDLISWII